MLWILIFYIINGIDNTGLNQMQSQIALLCISKEGHVDFECVNRLKIQGSIDEKNLTKIEKKM